MTVLKPGENCWRIETAPKAAVLFDGAGYFGVLREVLKRAEKRIAILGWDMDSRMKLMGDTLPDDGMPVEFAAFLTALCKAKPQLQVRLLLWDYSVIYAREREFLPSLKLAWRTPSNVRFCLDDRLPLGSSHHQKLVVVDDCIAFCGGIDITGSRWDRSAHDPDDPLRVRFDGKPYDPYHDMQMMVNGPAAHALAQLACQRWCVGACEELEPLEACDPVWPDCATPDFHDLPIAIARTEPLTDRGAPVREVERLWLDSLAAAERFVYIENQFLANDDVAHALARRLREKPQLEAMLVSPREHPPGIAGRAMATARTDFLRILEGAGVADRVRLRGPTATGDSGRSADVMVHAKLCIIDGRMLRIGSANINNRSMGTDSECDLFVDAAEPQHREKIAHLRNRLIAEHLAQPVDRIADILTGEGPILPQLDALLDSGNRRLEPLGDIGIDPPPAPVQAIADPPKPLGADKAVARLFGGRVTQLPFRSFLRFTGLALALIVLALLWQFTPLSELTNLEKLQEAFRRIGEQPLGPIYVGGVFVVGGMIFFPVTLLIVVTAAIFGPWLGFLYALTGTLMSAGLSYGLGRVVSENTLSAMLGPRLDRIRTRIARSGLFAVVAARMVPVAPFTLVNMVAGATRVRFWDFMLGTVLGMGPGMIALCAFGHQAMETMASPSLQDGLMLVGFAALWIWLSFRLQALVMRWRDKRENARNA